LDHVALGMDLRVAGSIRAKLGSSRAGHVTVERFWQPPSSTLIVGLTKLAHAHRALATKVAQAAALSASAKAVLEGAGTAKAAANAQLDELSKAAPVDKAPDVHSPWWVAWDHASSRADADVAGLARVDGEAAAALAELQELQSDLETFITATLTAPAVGSSTLARAMRAEWLAGDASRVLLYVAPLAAGLDQVMETKLGADRRVVLAGASFEYAAVGSNSELKFAGVFDSLWGGTMKLDKLSDFVSERIDYVPVPNAHRVERGG
jgi:ABC-type transporter Mla MlaB component